MYKTSWLRTSLSQSHPLQLSAILSNSYHNHPLSISPRTPRKTATASSQQFSKALTSTNDLHLSSIDKKEQRHSPSPSSQFFNSETSVEHHYLNPSCKPSTQPSCWPPTLASLMSGLAPIPTVALPTLMPSVPKGVDLVVLQNKCRCCI